MTSPEEHVDVADVDLDETAGEEPGEPVIVAVDFTAGSLRVALADLDGELVHHEEHALPALPHEAAWAWEVGGRISTAFAREGEQRWALAIGVACPGAVDPIAGRITESHGQPEWNGLSVVEALRRHIDAPIVALNRTQAALRGETSSGAAVGAHDVLYVSLRGRPQAAIMVSGRVAGGAAGRAGALPALPTLDEAVPLEDDLVQAVTGLLADAAAILDPAVVVLDGWDEHLAALGPVLSGVLDELAPGIRVVSAVLGDNAALAGALQAASIVAFEGERYE